MRVEVPEREAGGERHVADLPLEMDVEGEVRDTQVVDALFSWLVSLAGDAAGDGQMILLSIRLHRKRNEEEADALRGGTVLALLVALRVLRSVP